MAIIETYTRSGPWSLDAESLGAHIEPVDEHEWQAMSGGGLVGWFCDRLGAEPWGFLGTDPEIIAGWLRGGLAS